MRTLWTCLIFAAALISTTSTVAAPAANAAGQAAFERICAACHLPSGEGMPGVFPPVKNSDYFKKSTPAQLVKLIDHGLTGPITVNGQQYNSAMPPLGLSDEDAAAVLNYVSATLNGGKPSFTVEQIKRLRAAK